MIETDFYTRVLDAISDMRTDLAADLATTTAEPKGVVARLDAQAATVAQHRSTSASCRLRSRNAGSPAGWSLV